MMTLVIISIVMAVAYVAAVIINDKKLPDSISALVYSLPFKGQWFWTLWLWAVSLTAGIPLLDIFPESWLFLAFMMLACIWFVAAMPIIWEEHKNAHNILGISACVLSQVCVAVVSPWCLMTWLIWPFLMGSTVIQPEGGDMRKLFGGKGVFVAEAVCATSVYIMLLFNL